MRSIHLCCGMGGDALGFKEAGFEVDYGLDSWRDAVCSFEKHIGAPARYMDLRDFEPGRADYDVVIVGGTPCQDFSVMGKRKIFSHRSQLVLEFCRIIDEIRPDAFMFENVIHLPKWAEAAMFDLKGYKVTKNVVDTMYYNVPQSRRRKVFVGNLSKFVEINPPPNAVIQTVRETLTKMTSNWGFTNHAQATINNFKRVKSGTGWLNNNKADYNGTIRLSWDAPACAITNVKKAQILHPDEDRIISLAEALALQGFPESFVPCGPDTSKAQQISNAIAPGLAKFVGTKILEANR